MKCVTSVRFTMSAQTMRMIDASKETDDYGEWVRSQDPLTGEFVRIWKPGIEDNLGTIDIDEAESFPIFNCLVRGIVDGGIRVAGTTERFSKTYDNIDFAHMWYPANVLLTKRDRVTNITDSTGHIKWLDEEEGSDPPKATVFNVNGVTPLFDAFNRHIENFALLERAE